MFSFVNFQGVCEDTSNCTLVYIPKYGPQFLFTNHYEGIETDFDNFAVVSFHVQVELMDFSMSYKKTALLTREESQANEYVGMLEKHTDL